MTDPKVSLWARVKRVFVGRPISYEEHRAAQTSLYRDHATIAYAETRNARFHAGSSF